MNISDFITLKPGLTYLDAAAMAPMHRDTVTFLQEHMLRMRTNVHRASYADGEDTDLLYHQTKQKMATLIGTTPERIAFTGKTSLSLNALSFSLQPPPNSTIWVTALEHHANYLPWQALAQRTGANFVEVPLQQNTLLPDEEWIRQQIAEFGGPYLFAFTHASNVTGGVVSISRMRELIGTQTYFVLDGAQAVAHLPVQLDDLNVDAYAFSGYKFGAMTETGVLYLSDRLSHLTPSFLGGGMVNQVHHAGSTFLPFPQGWEMGTPHIDGIPSLPIAYERWFQNGHETFIHHERQLLAHLLDEVKKYPFIEPVVKDLPLEQRIGVFSFNVAHWHAHDVGTLLGEQNIAVRVGQHCAHPLFQNIKKSASIRISFGPYNDLSDVEQIITTLRKTFL